MKVKQLVIFLKENELEKMEDSERARIYSGE